MELISEADGSTPLRRPFGFCIADKRLAGFGETKEEHSCATSVHFDEDASSGFKRCERTKIKYNTREASRLSSHGATEHNTPNEEAREGFIFTAEKCQVRDSVRNGGGGRYWDMRDPFKAPRWHKNGN